jgi:ABC-type multidrug transport system ATPase subunit
MTEPVLVADSIRKSAKGQHILMAASLSVPRGSVVGLLGRVGAGKSTLLKVCAGLTAADSGWVEFGGKREMRPRLARLSGDGLFFAPDQRGLALHLTVRQHFEAIGHRYGNTDYGEIVELLQLKDFLDAYPSRLSGGEERRAILAVSMARKPRCLLSDEPFRGVDPLSLELVGRGFRRLAGDGCGVVVTGHEVNALRPFLDSVTWVTAGTTYQLGAPEEAWKNDRFRREYLGD